MNDAVAIFRRNALLRLLIGTVFISFSAVFVKLVSVPPTVSAMYRVLIGGIILLALLRIRQRKPFAGMRAGLFALFAAALFFAADLWVWHRSIIYIGPGLATLLGNFQVFFLAIAGVVVFGEKWRWQLGVAVPLGIVGLGLIVGFDWSVLEPQYRTGLWLGLLTAVFYTGYILSLRGARRSSKGRGPLADIAIVSLLSAGLLIVVAAGEGVAVTVPDATDVGILFAYALVAQVIGWVLISGSLSEVPTSQVGLILLSQPLLTFVWDVLFFSRGVTPKEMIGIGLTLFAIYLGSMRARSNRASKPE